MKNDIDFIPIRTIDDYISRFPEKVAEMLEILRYTIQSAAPEAEEMISYGIPAFKYHGMLVYFAAYKKHYSLYGGGLQSVMAELSEELKGYKTLIGTIQFTYDKPLPTDLVMKIVQARMQQNIDKEAEKAEISREKRGKKG